jgi:exodeoxyribonuclease-3
MSDESKAEKFLELFNKGKEFTEELLRENQRLRYRVAELETEQSGLSAEELERLRDQVRALAEENQRMQARYLEAVISVPSGALRLLNIYLPNGNPSGTKKFVYKLAWMSRLKERVKSLLALEEPLVIAGDFNVIPAPEDVYNPSAWMEDALFRPETRAHFQALLNLGLTDAFRACHDEPHRYTFWDYQAGAWQKNQGLRIDHLLLSPQAADRLVACEIDPAPRGWEKPSDHVPIFIELAV